MPEPTLLDTLSAILDEWYPDDPKARAYPPQDVESAPPPCPTYALATNSEVLRHLFDAAARRSGLIDTLSEYRKLHQLNFAMPTKPDVNDPEFTPPAKLSSPRKKDIARAILFNKGLKSYEQRLKDALSRKARIEDARRFANSHDGYLDYCLDAFRTKHPTIADRFLHGQRPVGFSKHAQDRHTFICGGTGSGKSETAKTLIRDHLVNNDACAIIVLDPHGQLAEDVCRFAENKNGRLIYVDPTAVHYTGRQLTLNPFHLSDRSEGAIEEQSLQLITAFKRVMTKPTDAMDPLLLHVITALLHRPGSTLADFITFMTDEPDASGTPLNEALRAEAARSLPFQSHRDYFEFSFRAKNLSPSKEGLAARFQRLVSQPSIQRMLCGSPTFSLERAIDEQQLIVFNLQSRAIGREAAKLLGQLVTALIQAYAGRRSSPRSPAPKHPIHLFADECQYFVSEATSEILEEARKSNFDINLITQSTHQIEPTSVLHSLFTNVGRLMIGSNQGPTVGLMERQADVPGSIIRNLATGQFILKEAREPVQKSRPTRLVRMPYVGNTHNMDADTYRNILARNFAEFYRPVDAPVERDRPLPNDTPRDPADPPSALPLPSDDDFRVKIDEHSTSRDAPDS